MYAVFLIKNNQVENGNKIVVSERSLFDQISMKIILYRVHKPVTKSMFS